MSQEDRKRTEILVIVAILAMVACVVIVALASRGAPLRSFVPGVLKKPGLKKSAP